MLGLEESNINIVRINTERELHTILTRTRVRYKIEIHVPANHTSGNIMFA